MLNNYADGSASELIHVQLLKISVKNGLQTEMNEAVTFSLKCA